MKHFLGINCIIKYKRARQRNNYTNNNCNSNAALLKMSSIITR